MAFEGNVDLLRFVGDGEIGFTGDTGLDFDEVDATRLEHVDGVASIFGCGDGDGGFISGLGAIEHGARDDHARTEDAVGGDLIAGVENGIERRAHVANAGDAVGEEQWED